LKREKEENKNKIYHSKRNLWHSKRGIECQIHRYGIIELILSCQTKDRRLLKSANNRREKKAQFIENRAH